MDCWDVEFVGFKLLVKYDVFLNFMLDSLFFSSYLHLHDLLLYLFRNLLPSLKFVLQLSELKYTMKNRLYSILKVNLTMIDSLNCSIVL